VEKVTAGIYDIESNQWANVSEEAKGLVKGLLNVDPK
jgi:hypothetical protein